MWLKPSCFLEASNTSEVQGVGSLSVSEGFGLYLLNRNEEASQGSNYISELMSAGEQNNVKINFTTTAKPKTPI